MKSNLLKSFEGFKIAFRWDEEGKRFFKVVAVLLFASPYIALYMTMVLLMLLNHWTNRLMYISVHVIIDIYQGYNGGRKLLLLLFLGVVLGPFIFFMYVAVIVYRILFRFVGLIYSIFFVAMILFNKDSFKSNMDECVKANQINDVF